MFSAVRVILEYVNYDIYIYLHIYNIFVCVLFCNYPEQNLTVYNNSVEPIKLWIVFSIQVNSYFLTDYQLGCLSY